MADKVWRITWVDSCSTDGWQDRETFPLLEEMICFSTGIIVGENEHSLYIAGSWNESEICDIMQIPLVAVRGRKELR